MLYFSQLRVCWGNILRKRCLPSLTKQPSLSSAGWQLLPVERQTNTSTYAHSDTRACWEMWPLTPLRCIVNNSSLPRCFAWMVVGVRSDINSHTVGDVGVWSDSWWGRSLKDSGFSQVDPFKWVWVEGVTFSSVAPVLQNIAAFWFLFHHQVGQSCQVHCLWLLCEHDCTQHRPHTPLQRQKNPKKNNANTLTDHLLSWVWTLNIFQPQKLWANAEVIICEERWGRDVKSRWSEERLRVLDKSYTSDAFCFVKPCLFLWRFVVWCWYFICEVISSYHVFPQLFLGAHVSTLLYFNSPSPAALKGLPCPLQRKWNKY